MSVLDDFESWKSFLGERLQQAQDHGMSEQKIADFAHEVGDYLSENVQPKNKEVAVIQQLWNAASEEEQQAIANTLIKLVQNDVQ